ncbi:MAG: hypothetical protein R3B07_27990 [Polyangiaceae bacterium]
MGHSDVDLPISLPTYAILLGHLRHFPADRHDEVLRRLDFEPDEWPAYADRGERALLARMEAGEDTSAFTKVLGETKRELKKKNPAVEELPLDQASAGPEQGPPRTMRLRDLDPVEFLNVMSSRVGTDFPAETAEPVLPAPVIPGVDLRPAPRPAVPPMPEMPRRAPPLPPMAPVAPPPRVDASEPGLSPAEEARRKSRAARAMFESTKVSPTSERMGVDSAPKVDVTVKESVSSPVAAPAPVEAPPPPPANEVSPATQMIQPEEAAFPGVQLPTLSVFEFATLCAEFNVCGEANKEKVRQKYGIPTEVERLALLDVWRTRLVQNPPELAEWKRQLDAATRHWQQIYKR